MSQAEKNLNDLKRKLHKIFSVRQTKRNQVLNKIKGIRRSQELKDKARFKKDFNDLSEKRK